MTDLQKAIDIKDIKRVKVPKQPKENKIKDKFQELMVVSYHIGYFILGASLLTTASMTFWFSYNHTFVLAPIKYWMIFTSGLIFLTSFTLLAKAFGRK